MIVSSLNQSLCITILFVGLIISLAPISYVNATNESSYRNGYFQGSLKSPAITEGANWNPTLDNNTCSKSIPSILNDGVVMPVVTNTTACLDGWYAGWKNWCINHALNCVGNLTLGAYPVMILQAHEQYLAGAKAATGNSMCPVGNSGAFCNGWDSNNNDYGTGDCGDIYVNYTGPFSNNLIGCPLDSINPTNMAKPHELIGKWNYLNESATTTISGILAFSSKGNFTLTVPNSGGDYTLEGSWGNQWKNLLTLCYAGGCQNSTLTTVTPNHIEFKDNNGNTIHLMREGPTYPISPETEVGATAAEIENLNLSGTWAFVNPSNNFTGASTITFDNYLRHASWNYTKYCCIVNIQRYTANMGHRIFEGYWKADLSPSNFPSSSTLLLCKYNIQDHGVYHADVNISKGILFDCSKMTVNIIDKDHLHLVNSAGDIMKLVRIVDGGGGR
jgi:hypothetical protein